MKIKKLRNLDYIQEKTRYATPGSVGIDLVSCLDTIIVPNSRVIVPTGIAVEFSPASFGLVVPRSGLAVVQGIGLFSSGIIDNDYRGEIMVGLINYSPRNTQYITEGMRVAQLVILPYHTVKLEWVNELSSTERGEGGHGSTGQ